MVNRQRNSRGRFVSRAPIHVRNESQVPSLEQMIAAGPTTFILIHADWCGPCQRYKPTWKDFEKTPGRTANIASVHHDMLEKVPTIANAKIQGYPSVIKVEPSGKIEEYAVPGSREMTNALPTMRDVDAMTQELTSHVANSVDARNVRNASTNVRNTMRNGSNLRNVRNASTNVRNTMRNGSNLRNVRNASTNVRNTMRNGSNLRNTSASVRGTLRNTVPANLMAASNGMPASIPVSSIAAENVVLPEPPKDSGAPGIQAGIIGQEDLIQKNVIASQTGGQRGGAFESVMGAFLGALQKAGPVGLLLLANHTLNRNKTYKSPKRTSRRGSTRKNRA